MFLNKVAEGRDLAVQEVDAIAGGRVWSGTAAEKLHLVDRLGGVLDAVEEAKTLASISPDEEVEIRVFPKERGILERIREGDFGIRGAAGKEVRGLLARYEMDALDFLPYTEEEGPVWARLPFALRE
jgi:protease-4